MGCIKDFGFALKSQETIKASVSMDTYADMELLTDTNDSTMKDAAHSTTAQISYKDASTVKTETDGGKVDSETCCISICQPDFFCTLAQCVYILSAVLSIAYLSLFK